MLNSGQGIMKFMRDLLTLFGEAFEERRSYEVMWIG